MTRLTRDDMRGKAQTVLGLIDPAGLGRTLMHEHVLCDIRPPGTRGDNDLGPEVTLENVWQLNYGHGVRRAGRKYMLDLEDIAVKELDLLRQEGGDTVVELSCGGLSPDPAGLRRISEGTGIRLVMGCGHYVNDYQDPRNRERTVDDFAAEMIDQVQVGAWGTDVRSGMIGEIGCQSPWTDLEKRVMRAALLAMQHTGAAINVHPGRHEDQPQEVADFIRAADCPTDRIVISHIDRTIFDVARLLRLAETGVTLEFDLFGQESSYYGLSDIDMPNDATRLKLIRALIDHGHLDRVVISHDICYRTRLSAFGGHGYGHIFRNVVPMMRRRAFTDDELDAILVRNPRRLLTFA
jgi:phosphotriesterase-related protein